MSVLALLLRGAANRLDELRERFGQAAGVWDGLHCERLRRLHRLEPRPTSMFIRCRPRRDRRPIQTRPTSAGEASNGTFLPTGRTFPLALSVDCGNGHDSSQPTTDWIPGLLAALKLTRPHRQPNCRDFSRNVRILLFSHVWVIKLARLT